MKSVIASMCLRYHQLTPESSTYSRKLKRLQCKNQKLLLNLRREDITAKLKKDSLEATYLHYQFHKSTEAATPKKAKGKYQHG